jgi:hypothetical protein
VFGALSPINELTIFSLLIKDDVFFPYSGLFVDGAAWNSDGSLGL